MPMNANDSLTLCIAFNIAAFIEFRSIRAVFYSIFDYVQFVTIRGLIIQIITQTGH